MKLTTQMPKLKMSGVILLLSLYAFMAWTGNILPIFLPALISKISTFCQQRVFAFRMILTVNCYFCQTGNKL